VVFAGEEREQLKTVSETPGCDGCPMQKLQPGATFVAPKMPRNGKDLVRLVIAEAPGQEENDKGEPLVGGSGKVFDRLCQAAGISRDGLTLSNCIQCKPPGNVFPTDAAARNYISKADAEASVQHCFKAHVEPLLVSRRWSRVDLLGDKPLRIVGGKSGISTWRGSPLSIHGTLKGIATYHPSYLMRDQVFLPVAVNDLKKSLEEPEEHYKPFPSLEDVQNFKYKNFAFDIECPKYRTMGNAAPVEMVGLCGKAGEAICVPVRGPYIPELRRIFLEAENLIGHNAIQFDIPKLFPLLGLEW
jgi:uracil-DNA glycosylase family 4